MNIAIIGFGGMGKFHYECILGVKRLLVTAVCDIDPERRASATSLGLKAVSDASEIFNDPEIDGVIIATPNDLHYHYALTAIQSGKAILLEKPACMESVDFETLTAAAEKSGVLLEVHQNRRLDEDYLTVKKAVREKIMGGTYFIESSVTAANGIPGQWRRFKRHGGGMVLDWGVHLFDQMLDLEDSLPVSVYARLSFISGAEVDDGFYADLRFASGLTARITVDTNSYFVKPRWVLYAKDGTAKIKDWDSPLSVRESVSAPTMPEGIKAGNGFTKTMAPSGEKNLLCRDIAQEKAEKEYFYKNFVAAFYGEEKPFVENGSVLRTLKLLEAVFEAYRLNKAVEL